MAGKTDIAMAIFLEKVDSGHDVNIPSGESAAFGNGVERLQAGASRLLLLLLVTVAVLMQGWLLGWIGWDGELTPTETESLFALDQAREGRQFYQDFRAPPHAVAQYMPLFYLVPGNIARGLRAGLTDTFLIGRLYTYTGWLAVAALLFALTRQAGGGRAAGGLAAALWLAGWLAPQWAHAYRPDAPALAWALAALWYYRHNDHSWQWIVVAGLLVMSALHKQSSVVVLSVILVAECCRGRYWRAVALGGSWAVVMGVAALVARQMSSGAFVLNVWTSVAQPAHWPQVVTLAAGALVGAAPVWVGSLMAIGILRRQRAVALLAGCFVAGLLLAVVSSFKAGAWLNYYLEPYAVGCILTALIWERWQRETAGRFVRWGQAAWLGLALSWAAQSLWHQVKLTPQAVQLLADWRGGRQRQSDAWAKLVQCIGPGEPVLSEDFYLSVRRGGLPYLINPGQFVGLQRLGKFDDRALMARLASGDFATIVAIQPLTMDQQPQQFPARWRAIMQNRYRLADECELDGSHNRFWIYRPKPAGSHE